MEAQRIKNNKKMDTDNQIMDQIHEHVHGGMFQGNEQDEKNKNYKGMKEQAQQEDHDKMLNKQEDIDTQKYELNIMNQINSQHGEDDSTGAV
eukprot:15271512-Heterocapsa_arctica.AAC.1